MGIGDGAEQEIALVVEVPAVIAGAGAASDVGHGVVGHASPISPARTHRNLTVTEIGELAGTAHEEHPDEDDGARRQDDGQDPDQGEPPGGGRHQQDGLAVLRHQRLINLTGGATLFHHAQDLVTHGQRRRFIRLGHRDIDTRRAPNTRLDASGALSRRLRCPRKDTAPDQERHHEHDQRQGNAHPQRGTPCPVSGQCGLPSTCATGRPRWPARWRG